MVALTEQIIRGKTRLEKIDEVKNLNLWGQDLDDVSVVAKMPNVEVLSLSVNRISTLRDFRHCTKLQELYLRKNYITDISEVQYLAGLNDLKVLWLCDNPCANHPLYRQLVAYVLPGVDKLDNLEVTPQDKEAAKRNPDLSKYLGAPPSPADAGSRPPSYPSPTHPPPPAPVLPPVYGTPAGSRPSSQQPPVSGGGGGYDGGMQRVTGSRHGSAGDDGGSGRRKKNILYAVMALVSELDADDLMYVRSEIEQRLGNLGR